MNSAFTKSSKNPVLGPGLGTCFDISVLVEDSTFQMWFSWRDKKAIALVESSDGLNWTKEPRIVVTIPSFLQRVFFGLKHEDVSRPCVILHQGRYHLWYSIHARTISIAYAVSEDGIAWKQRTKPVLSPDRPWEKDAIMCPCVIYDDQERVFKMWYSGGEKYEPDALGYATSPDGITWQKHPMNPIFKPDPLSSWEKDRVTAMHVMKDSGYYLGFYIGFANGFENSCIGMARSKDGIHDWERYEGNPILAPGPSGSWDDCNVYKPYVIHHKGKWMLWYNASRHSDRAEQIGLATCDQVDFWSAKK